MTPAPLPSDLIEAEARELGFGIFGVTDPRRSDHGAFLRGWLEDGRHGEMRWLGRPESVTRREDLSLTLSEVRSVIVVGHEYGDPDREQGSLDPATGTIARYARGRDYHRVIPKRLRNLGAAVERLAGRPVLARGYTDTGPIFERELAQRAGLGWFGRNTMLIHPRKGSYFFLGAVLVDIDIELSDPFERDHCGTCRACLDTCPTGALLGRDDEGAPVMDARRCISYLTIELRGPIPEELRPAIGNRIFGCDICQEVCPFNQRFGAPPLEPGYAPRLPVLDPSPGPGGQASAKVSGTVRPPLVDLMRMTWDEWDVFTRGSAIRRAGYDGFRRNVAVALGNWGSEEARVALKDALGDPSGLVREHVEWALGQPRRTTGSDVSIPEDGA